VSIVYGEAVWLEDISFSCGSAFILCPGDVVVEEHMLSGHSMAFEVTSVKVVQGLKFECTGHCCQCVWGGTVGEGGSVRSVRWVCCVLWKRGVCIANGNVVARFWCTIRKNSVFTISNFNPLICSR
jgi:hypothetical protein